MLQKDGCILSKEKYKNLQKEFKKLSKDHTELKEVHQSKYISTLTKSYSKQ